VIAEGVIAPRLVDADDVERGRSAGRGLVGGVVLGGAARGVLLARAGRARGLVVVVVLLEQERQQLLELRHGGLACLIDGLDGSIRVRCAARGECRDDDEGQRSTEVLLHGDLPVLS